MRELVRTGMREGAFGLSTGLFYVPGNLRAARGSDRAGEGRRRSSAASTSRTCATRPAQVLDSVRDTIAIGEQGGLPTQVTHHKIIGKANWGRSVDTLRLIDEARARGVDVDASISTRTPRRARRSRAALVPQWAQEGGRETDAGAAARRDHRAARR